MLKSGAPKPPYCSLLYIQILFVTSQFLPQISLVNNLFKVVIIFEGGGNTVEKNNSLDAMWVLTVYMGFVTCVFVIPFLNLLF